MTQQTDARAAKTSGATVTESSETTDDETGSQLRARLSPFSGEGETDEQAVDITPRCSLRS